MLAEQLLLKDLITRIQHFNYLLRVLTVARCEKMHIRDPGSFLKEMVQVGALVYIDQIILVYGSRLCQINVFDCKRLGVTLLRFLSCRMY